MTAAEALDRADEFLLEFDPDGVYDPQEARLFAMAILYGERIGIMEGCDLALSSLHKVAQEFEQAGDIIEAVSPLKAKD